MLHYHPLKPSYQLTGKRHSLNVKSANGDDKIKNEHCVVPFSFFVPLKYAHKRLIRGGGGMCLSDKVTILATPD